MFLSKVSHIPIDILHFVTDSWGLEFWLIHFPLIINPISLPECSSNHSGKCWTLTEQCLCFGGHGVHKREKARFVFWFSLAIVERSSLWMPAFQAQGCVLFCSPIQGAAERRSRYVVNPSLTDTCWWVISKSLVRQHPIPGPWEEASDEGTVEYLVKGLYKKKWEREGAGQRLPQVCLSFVLNQVVDELGFLNPLAALTRSPGSLLSGWLWTATVLWDWDCAITEKYPAAAFST